MKDIRHYIHLLSTIYNTVKCLTRCLIGLMRERFEPAKNAGVSYSINLKKKDVEFDKNNKLKKRSKWKQKLPRVWIPQ